MAKSKIEKTLHEFKEGSLHSGSKHGPKVTDRKQAVAIALSQARKEGIAVPPPHHSNPTEYYGNGDTPAVSDGGGPLQIIDPMEMLDQFEDGPDEFMCDFGDRPELQWPGAKVKKFPRGQAY